MTATSVLNATDEELRPLRALHETRNIFATEIRCLIQEVIERARSSDLQSFELGAFEKENPTPEEETLTGLYCFIQDSAMVIAEYISVMDVISDASGNLALNTPSIREAVTKFANGDLSAWKAAAL